MRDLRLVGVHEDGQHLLLSDGAGERYRLPLDEALRAAARRDRAHLGQLQIEIDGGLRPKDVQALIRSGLSAREVADRAGWTVEKVRRFEGPVLAEREYVAGLAQNVVVGERAGRGPTLGARVATRLRDRGVDPAYAVWDSARQEDGTWRVSVEFPAGGRERQATWQFVVEDRDLEPVNDEARWLSGEAAPDGPIPAPHRPAATGPMAVYDVERDGGVDGAARPRARHADEPIDLVAAMRDGSARTRRRGRRAQPTLPALTEPPADATPVEPLLFDPDVDEPPPAVSGRGRPGDAEPEPRGGSRPPADDGEDEVPAATPLHPGRRRNGRPSVPAWDDIMFGGTKDSPDRPS